jgi:hypothetical protein
MVWRLTSHNNFFVIQNRCFGVSVVHIQVGVYNGLISNENIINYIIMSFLKAQMVVLVEIQTMMQNHQIWFL